MASHGLTFGEYFFEITTIVGNKH